MAEENVMGASNDGEGSSHSSWRAEDLLDLERCGLAADLASTNLGPGHDGNASVWGHYNQSAVEIAFNTYDMSEVLDNIIDDMPLLCDSTPPVLSTPIKVCSDCSSVVTLSEGGDRECEVVLNAPTAYGIRLDREPVTYLNRGQLYEIQLQHSYTSPAYYKSTLTLSFCELRWRNNEVEHFESWSREHPHSRLLEIDYNGCAGLQCVENDDTILHRVHMSWVCVQKQVVLAVKLNCLSTEFALKKHGGEKGVPLKLVLEVYHSEGKESSEVLVYRRACGIKVFKDKGGDRKQRQDQLKMEKVPPCEQSKYRASEAVSQFQPLSLDDSSGQVLSPATPYQTTPDRSTSLTPGAPSFSLATPHNSTSVDTPFVSITACTTVKDTCKWLLLNRFGQYCSHFTNYAGHDLLRLSRRDLMQLCGHADGIRLFNSLRNTTLKTIYVRLLPEDKVYHAVCLEELTARTFLLKLLEKVGWLSIDRVSSFLQLTGIGLLVKVDDSLVLSMQDEDSFLVQTVEEEDGSYQVVLQYQVPAPACNEAAASCLTLSLAGATHRH